MKRLKLLLAFATSLLMCLSSCSISRNANTLGKSVNLDIQLFQTLTDNSALAMTKKGPSYYGDVVKIITSEDTFLYDGLKMKGRYVLVGTYRYTSKDDRQRTVPVYIKRSEYNMLKKDSKFVLQYMINNY